MQAKELAGWAPYELALSVDVSAAGFGLDEGKAALKVPRLDKLGRDDRRSAGVDVAPHAGGADTCEPLSEEPSLVEYLRQGVALSHEAEPFGYAHEAGARGIGFGTHDSARQNVVLGFYHHAAGPVDKAPPPFQKDRRKAFREVPCVLKPGRNNVLSRRIDVPKEPIALDEGQPVVELGGLVVLGGDNHRALRIYIPEQAVLLDDEPGRHLNGRGWGGGAPHPEDEEKQQPIHVRKVLILYPFTSGKVRQKRLTLWQLPANGMGFAAEFSRSYR